MLTYLSLSFPLSPFLRVQYSREWVITLCSNPKITRLAQLQSRPHYTALQNRGRNSRPIKTKRESGDVRKGNIEMAGVDLTCLGGECPIGTGEQSACYVPQILCSYQFVRQYHRVYNRNAIDRCSSHTTCKYYPKNITMTYRTHAYTFLLNPAPLVWSGLGSFQRRLFA